MQRFQSNRRLVRYGLLGAASLSSLLIAGQAHAQCVSTPSQPLNAVTADETVIDCTGTVASSNIYVVANGTVTTIAPGTAVSGTPISITGDNSAVTIGTGATVANSPLSVTGASNTVTIDGFLDNVVMSLTGPGSTLTLGSNSVANLVPGSLGVFGTAGSANTINLHGDLNATGFLTGSAMVVGGDGNQTVNLTGSLDVQSDGKAISLGDGDDQINIASGATITGGSGNNIMLDGGAGEDGLRIEGSLISTYNSVEIESLVIDTGAGGFHGIDGTHSDLTQVTLLSGATRVRDASALGVSNSTVTIDSDATLIIAAQAPASFNQSFAGAGQVGVASGGNVVTFGGHSAGFTGNLLIDTGNIVAIATDDAFGSGTISNGGVLTFNSVEISNAISGTGTLIKTGPNLGILSGASTYTGGTIVQDGTLRLTHNNAAGTGAIALSAGTALDLDLGAASATLSNAIIGSGTLMKHGTGTIELTGSNSHSGGTSISAGALQVDGFARLGTGATTVDAGASLILDYSGASQLLQLTSFMSGGGSFIKDGSGDVVLDAASFYTGGTVVRAGRLGLNDGGALGTGAVQIDSGATLGIGNISLNNDISGAGSIVKTASGNAGLYGDNSTFTGTIDVQDGAIVATAGEALGSGTLIIGTGTSVDVNIGGGVDSTLAAGLAGDGLFTKSGGGRLTLTGTGSLTGTVEVANGTLRIEGGQNVGTAELQIDSTGVLELSTAQQTVLQNDITGTGSLTKIGSGTVFLQGANTYSGGTDIQQGALRVTDVSFLGSGPVQVQSGAALDLSIAGQQVLSQTVSGAGILRKSDQGDLTLTANALTGGVDIVGGRVIVGSTGALGGGPVSMAADTQLVFDIAGTEVSTVPISGAGTLTKEGAGLLVISNANTFTGGTLINAGRLGLNNGQGLGTGDVLVLQNAVLGIGGVTLANNVHGAGQIIKTANNAATLTGTNTHSGGIDIQAGSIDVAGNAPLGSGTVTIASGAALNYTNAGAATFSNGLAGGGTFNKLGTGQLTFANNFTLGTVSLLAGRTRINVVGTTNVLVNPNASLDGTGRIIGNLTNNGLVAPGNSIGTLTVQGNYVHNAGSVLEIEFDGNGGIDLLAVTGTATINGGTLRFVSLGGAEGSGGTFLTAAGGLTGTFANVETVGAQLPLAVIYQPNSGLMAPSVLTARPSTFNAQSLAAADTALGFIDSLAAGDPRTGQGNRVWMNGFGAWGSRSASGSTLAYDHDSRGLSGGVNFAAGGALTLGAAIGWARGDIALGSNGGGGDQSSLMGSVTARYAGDKASVGAGVIYGKVDQDTVRNISFNGFSGAVSGATDSKVFGAFAELGLPLGSSGGWAFSATGRGAYLRQVQDAYTESGNSPLRLQVGKLTTETLEGQLRLTGKTKLWSGDQGGGESGEGLDLRIDLGGRYLGALGDRAIPVTFAASGAGVVLQGDTRDSLQGLAGLALDYTTRGGATFSLGYRGEVGQTDRHAVHAGLSFAF